MSLDFSPVKMSSSSRTTSSVFQMITLSSNLPWQEMRKYAFRWRMSPQNHSLYILINTLLCFPWWNVKSGARCSQILRKHIDPHLNSPLRGIKHRTTNCFFPSRALIRWRQQAFGVGLTCSIPGLSGWSSGLVSTCSGMSLHPTRGISSQCFNTVRARCSSVLFFKPDQ